MLLLSSSPTLREIRDALAAVPEENWCINQVMKPNQQQCCALGHVRRLVEGGEYVIRPFPQRQSGPLERRLVEAIDRFLTPAVWEDWDMSPLFEINDHPTDLYPQPTPKQRVLALLDDMLAAGIELNAPL